MTLENAVFLSGIELPDGTLMMAAQNGKFDIATSPHSIIKLRSTSNGWSDAGQLSWTTAAVSNNKTDDGITLLGPYGRWLEFRTNGHDKGSIIVDVDEEDPPTTFRFLKCIAGELYAGGTDRYIFRKTLAGWEQISTEEMTSHQAAGSAENLTGFGADELYAIGWDGELWTNQGGRWRQIDSPTNLILNDADVLNDKVYVGGQVGTILEGRGDDWNIIENNELKQDIWSVRSFGSAVYFSAMSGILRLKNGELQLIKSLGPDMRSAMSLFTGPSGLWSVGASDICLFDGDTWQTIAQS